MSEYFRSFIKKENYPIPPNQIRFKTNFSNCVVKALRNRKWKETDSELEWDVIWAERDWISEVFDHVHLAPNQKVNHFRNHWEVTRKDHMVKNLKRYKRQLEKDGKNEIAKELDFCPLTYNLPNEYPLFKDEYTRSSSGTVWIMEPVGRAQGKGIFLFDKISQISHWKSDFRWKPDNPSAEPYIVQRYIANPLLIGAKKFDMRIYLLCTNYNPLTLYLYRSGFCRFTHQRYTNDDITTTHLHITNHAIQKNSSKYKKDRGGGKWDLRNMKLFLISKYGEERVNECFSKMQKLMIHTYKSVQKVIINDKHCFELYGLDIMLDDTLKPWLLETNASPSLTGSNEEDTLMKLGLLDDTLTTIDAEKILTGQEVQVGGFDLIYKGGPIIMAANSTLQTLLGCHNNRINQSKQLAKSAAMRLSQQKLEKKKQPAVTYNSRYPKNFSTLPAKTGATFKESYKIKIKRKEEDRETQASKKIQRAKREEAKEKREKLKESNRITSQKKPRQTKQMKRGKSIRKEMNGGTASRKRPKKTGKKGGISRKRKKTQIKVTSSEQENKVVTDKQNSESTQITNN